MVEQVRPSRGQRSKVNVKLGQCRVSHMWKVGDSGGDRHSDGTRRRDSWTDTATGRDRDATGTRQVEDKHFIFFYFFFLKKKN